MISRIRISSRWPALDVAPALRPVAAHAQLPPGQPGRHGDHARPRARAADRSPRPASGARPRCGCRRCRAAAPPPPSRAQPTGRKPRWWWVSRWSMAMPASRTRATWASSSRSTSAGIDPPLHPGGDEVLAARPESAVGRQQRPDACRRSATGPPPHRARWTPTPSVGASPSIAPRAGRSGALPSSDVLVTIPSRWARKIPREMAGRHAEIVGVDDQTDLLGAHDRRIMPSFARDAPALTTYGVDDIS